MCQCQKEAKEASKLGENQDNFNLSTQNKLNEWVYVTAYMLQ